MDYYLEENIVEKVELKQRLTSKMTIKITKV
jgi:hypothetical protein